ncbi:MAG TPA: metalloregulator ArsR/SmtB family transcription factor [Vineibacter sp.]|nr:metalloregulator ArsR/SmtB family transcription factor [Vineibacter sp.]
MIEANDSLNTLFQALADPHRRGMIDQLARGPASVTELAQAHGMAMPSAVKHLKILETAGLVSSHKAGRVRTFAVRPQALRSIDDWLAGHKRALNAAFDRLQQLMEDEQRTAEP